ncbi:MAG TPA: PAS domain S-box protein, partial [Flavisolibacter sp.]|nr:PAS domain S-box protein [Flavisolibacter sp.]
DDRIMAIVRDVSERREAEKVIKESEEKYRSLIEQQADAITIFDKQGRIQHANTSATQLLQYTREELQNMTLTDILLAEDVKSDPVSFTAINEGVAIMKQRRLRKKDGSLVHTEVNAKHLWDGLFIASVRDLTERIAVQHLLAKEKELSDSIINSLPGLFYLFTKEGQYLRWNKQQEIISGYSPEEIVTMNPLNFIADNYKTAVEAAITETFEKGTAAIEAELLTKEGKSIPYYFTGIKVQYAGTLCLLGTGIDLSAMKNLEEQLSQQKIAGQKKIMQAMIDAEEKEKAKLGLELHDNISQILSVVRMYLAILDSNEVPEGITLQRTTQLLDSAINEIRGLSHNLAISYKFEGGLTEALKELIDNIRLARDFSVDFKTPPALDESTNANQKLALYRIVQEQLNNIIKYAKASAIAVQVAVTNNEVDLTISDNGKGFNPLNVEKGLGLNNITNRTEALGGRVKIQSAPGKGCQVMVQIPLQPTQA